MPLSNNDIESELSYAYLHAVASRAGLNCKSENRHGDNYTIDAQIDHYDKIPGTYITDVSLRIQLKATAAAITETATHFSYYLRGVEQYDRLRENRGGSHRLLVVLFLPQESSEWLKCSEAELSLKNAAYWVSLFGAPATANENGVTIYVPKDQLLNEDSLRSICQQIGRGNIPSYIMPDI